MLACASRLVRGVRGGGRRVDPMQMRSNRRRGLQLLCFVASVAVTAASGAAAPAAAGREGACGRSGYSYAGFASADRAHGIRATITSEREPSVVHGHVAAWVGVGGPAAGPGGADAWLQVGVSAVSGGVPGGLYYEVVRPGRAPRYTFVGDVHAGEPHEVAVLEVAGRAGTWRVWVDGVARSAPIHLPGSSGRWQPIATAETWDGGRRVCNRFDFTFAGVQVAREPGGSWRSFVGGRRFEAPGYRLVRRSVNSFRASAA